MENTTLVDYYRKWIIQRGTEAFPITENESGNLEIASIYALGRVNFYEGDTVELRIDTIRDEKTEFFLHFQINDLKRAQDLYVEMEEAMRHLRDSHAVNILLSCTSGLTTSYYAQLLNEAAKTLKLNYYFKAVSFNSLENSLTGQDMVLLAPQVHFEREKLQAKYPDILFRNIPGQTFGSYDTGSLIETIKGELQDYEALTTPKAERTRSFFETDKKILTIGYINGGEGEHCTIIYRYYSNGDIVCNYEKKAGRVSIGDIESIIDEMLQQYPEIEVIGLSLPGSIEDGVVYLPSHPIHLQNVKEILSEKYHRHVIPFNDANMIVTGIYWLEDKYSSLIFYYLPDDCATAGCGIVVGGHLIRGRQHVAGEVQYSQKVLQLSKPAVQLSSTQQGTVELIGKTLVTMVSTLGPEAIFLYADKVDEEVQIKEEMQKYMDEKFIPPLYKLQDIREYMMTGTFLRCIWRMDDLKRAEFGLTHNPYL